MIITLSRFMAEEVSWKLDVLFDNEEGLESYGISQYQCDKLQKSIPVKGEWDVPEWAIPILKEEMRDFSAFMRMLEPVRMPQNHMPSSNGGFMYQDGGRADAGYKGYTGDCVTRAISNATGLSYQQVYDELYAKTKEYANTRRDRVAKRIQRDMKKGRATPRNGVHREIYQPYLESLGWKWVATMKIGSGCKVHVRAEELPMGKVIVRLSRHLSCMIDGVLVDTYDCSREGTRCVYGYFIKIDEQEKLQ